jgi:hypothetical protein
LRSSTVIDNRDSKAANRDQREKVKRKKSVHFPPNPVIPIEDSSFDEESGSLNIEDRKREIEELK